MEPAPTAVAARRPRLSVCVAIALALLPPTLLGWWWATTASGPRQELLAHVLYWLMPVHLGIAAVAATRWWRAVRPTAAQWRAATLAAGGAAALAALTVLAVEPRHRMQWDETSLLGTAQGMHRQRAALLTGSAVPFAGDLVPLEQTLDKRPPLFPFLVSVLHDASGYRPANAFVVNAIALGLALLVVGLAVGWFGGAIPAATAMLLLLASPLTSLAATSGGLEMLAGLLLVVVLAQALAVVREPSAVRVELLLATGLVFAAVRYEALPLLLLVLGLAAWQTRGRWRCAATTRWLLLLLPTLLTPLVLLLLHGRQDRFYPEANGEPLLALAHFVDHVGPLLHWLFAPRFETGEVAVLSWLAVVAWGHRLFRRQATASDLLVVVPIAAATTLTLAWFYGDVREVTAQRLFVPIVWFCALSPLLTLAGTTRGVRIGVLVAAAAFAVFRVHVVRRGGDQFAHPVARLTEAVERVLPELGADRGKTLFVSSIAQHLVVHGYAAMTPAAFCNRLHEVEALRRQDNVRVVYVIETPLDADLDAGVRARIGGFGGDVVHAASADSPLVVRRLRF